MGDTPPADPFALTRDMVSQWEKGVNALLAQHMSTSEFAKQMHEAMATSEQSQAALKKVLAPMSIATKQDVAQIMSRLQAIEESLARVVDLVERLAPKAESTPRPKPAVARTKRFSKADSAKS
jgi:hypothetical protein